MNQDIKFKVIDLLKTRGAYTKSVNGKQHYTRCPYCGDSRNLSHAHLSIKIDVDTDDPMLYRCLKCGASGMVTDAVLEELDIFVDKEMSSQLRAFNKKAMRLGKLVNTEVEKFAVPLYQENSLNNIKLNYINKRLGTEFTVGKAHENKFVLNIFDFMSFNYLKEIPGISWKMLKNINTNYIGFLSCNNNCIVFRDITGNQKYRYFKMVLNVKNMNPDTFYSIPNSISLMYTNDINIHIAEGTFDILSIKENLIKDNMNNYFFAMCGFGGMTVLKYLLHHGINTGINLHIYSDKDKSEWDHKKYLYGKFQIHEWIDHIYFHINQCIGEKDYGVPINRIDDSFKIIK